MTILFVLFWIGVIAFGVVLVIALCVVLGNLEDVDGILLGVLVGAGTLTILFSLARNNFVPNAESENLMLAFFLSQSHLLIVIAPSVFSHEQSKESAVLIISFFAVLGLWFAASYPSQFVSDRASDICILISIGVYLLIALLMRGRHGKLVLPLSGMTAAWVVFWSFAAIALVVAAVCTGYDSHIGSLLAELAVDLCVLPLFLIEVVEMVRDHHGEKKKKPTEQIPLLVTKQDTLVV